MCNPQTFDSRDSRYKRPYGAVPSGTRVELALRPPRAGGFSAATLIAYFEHRDEERRELPMPWRGLEGDRDVFDIALETGDYVGLVWYSFRLEGLDGRREELGPFQLTVYDGAEEVPAWFGEGVTYQIFPDRFRRTRVPDPTGMVGGRSVHTGWEEEPVYRPDSNGEVRNRDFFGGDLAGVREKLGYLRGLGVDTLYFCPIFEAPENHRYGTGDYEKIDPMLGTEADFRALCAEAHALGMRVVLDGVFNHQGFVSRYFNGDGSYESVGAVQSQDSPYYPWYHFSHWPDKYDSWWGIYSLPAVNEADSSYRRYIFGGADSIIRRWLAAGADGWRLDVADELPDDFIHGIHAAARQAKPEAVIIGEVWEDGSNKIAYSQRRRYLLGSETHGLMNYPFRTALLAYLSGGDADDFREAMETLRENYPPAAFYSAMNFLGTHDTPRILTLLGADRTPDTKAERASYRLLPRERAAGIAKLRLAALVLFTFPGSPMIYYGDEAGVCGWTDPDNRRTFPWGKEDLELTEFHRYLTGIRNRTPAFRRGAFKSLLAENGMIAYGRFDADEQGVVVVNSEDYAQRVRIPVWEAEVTADAMVRVMLTDAKRYNVGSLKYPVVDGVMEVELPGNGAMIFIARSSGQDDEKTA